MCFDESVQYASDLNRSLGTGDHAAVEASQRGLCQSHLASRLHSPRHKDCQKDVTLDPLPGNLQDNPVIATAREPMLTA